MAKSITDGPEGPEGWEEIEFAYLGIRFAVLNESTGSLSDYGHYDPAMLGGAVPQVGDTFSMLWPAGDPDNNETYEVYARYYVGEFNGDNSWWVLIKERRPSKQDLAVFKMARTASKESRRIQKLRANNRDRTFADAMTLAEPKKPRSKPRPK